MAPTYAAAASVFAAASVSLSGCGSGGDSPTPSPPPGPFPHADCLCLFDVDRTLTGQQGNTADCPDNVVLPNIDDQGYEGGTLTMSAGGLNLVNTFCAECYIGIVSAGNASGLDSGLRSILRGNLNVGVGTLPFNWGTDGCASTGSPLVPECTDGSKQTAIPAIVQWYKDQGGAEIAPVNITLFDDRESNIKPFEDPAVNPNGYNAVQISCDTRDDPFGNHDEPNAIGKCGATVAEIQAFKRDKGVHLCHRPYPVTPAPAPAPAPPPAPATSPAPAATTTAAPTVLV